MAALSALVLASCTSAGGPIGDTPPTLPPDPAVAAAAIAATAPAAPIQATFRWTLDEPDARFNGEGVVRIEPPYRARIDLFGPRGEAYLSAVLVGDELRLPPGADPAAVPPVPLLWSVLGVLRPPPDATLTRAQVAPGPTALGYTLGDDVWRFQVRAGNLVEAVWEGSGEGRHSVSLEPSSGALPARAAYRDWLAYRELTLELETEEHVEGFPGSIWLPGG